MTALKIAIDGPAGAGKSTVAKEIARRLNIRYIDTGLLYRCVAWAADHYWSIDPTNAVMAQRAAESLVIDLQRGKAVSKIYIGRTVNTDDEHILWQAVGQDELRSERASKAASDISAHEGVRKVIGAMEKKIAAEAESFVVEGRDTTTVSFKDAEVKIYLTASLYARSMRRARQIYGQNAGVTPMEIDDLMQKIKKRDYNDTHRDVAPLRCATSEGVIRIDSTHMTVDQVVEKILACRKTPTDQAADAFNEYCTMGEGKLPSNPQSAMQVALFRWGVNTFPPGRVPATVERVLGVNEETGELAEALLGFIGLQASAGKLAHMTLKNEQKLYGLEDRKKYIAGMADALADHAIYAIQLATALRLDYWTLVNETAAKVMERTRENHYSNEKKEGVDE